MYKYAIFFLNKEKIVMYLYQPHLLCQPEISGFHNSSSGGGGRV